MSNTLIIRQPSKEEEFEAMYELRWRVLRKPWNQPKGSEKDDLENQSFPFIAISDEKIIGTARLQKNSEIEGQIRYLAINEEYRNQKIGRDLILFIEWYASKKNCSYLKLNARKTAHGFFIKQGYEIVGEGPTLFNEIEHYVMKKELKI